MKGQIEGEFEKWLLRLKLDYRKTCDPFCWKRHRFWDKANDYSSMFLTWKSDSTWFQKDASRKFGSGIQERSQTEETGTELSTQRYYLK